MEFWKVIRSTRVVLQEGVTPATVALSHDGKISVVEREKTTNDWDSRAEEVIDVGNLVIMPGIVDSHVHINEPGRTHWEGFWSATQAAAAGGVTTVVDMPLNSIPPTTTSDHLKTKQGTAQKQIYVDVGFWGGIIPDNKDSLLNLVDAGVVGFKCFLCPSGVDEFPHVDEEHLSEALSILQGKDIVVAFHAEVSDECAAGIEGNRKEYQTFLKTRTPEMETKAVELVSRLCGKFGVACHIVHASSHSVLQVVKKAKDAGFPLTAETCHHYLTLEADTVPPEATSFKCCPPIRDKENKELLWDHLKSGNIDLVVSDHSPCSPELKDGGDFISAWGGISSVQFGLSLLWTEASKRDLSLTHVSRLLSEAPAKLCGLSSKGSIQVGKDADLVIFDPDDSFKVTKDIILHKHKVTPYLGKTLRGRVIRTYVRGNEVFRKGQQFPPPQGKFLRRS